MCDGMWPFSVLNVQFLSFSCWSSAGLWLLRGTPSKTPWCSGWMEAQAAAHWKDSCQRMDPFMWACHYMHKSTCILDKLSILCTCFLQKADIYIWLVCVKAMINQEPLNTFSKKTQGVLLKKQYQLLYGECNFQVKKRILTVYDFCYGYS